MTPPLIASARLINQRIADTDFTKPSEIVRWMGAMQAQDYFMAKRAIGLRIKNATDKSVEIAFSRGEFLRTHLLRPTWHFVAPEDIRWMIRLSAPQIKIQMRARDRQLELTEAVFTKSNLILGKFLSEKGNATRDEISEELNKSGIKTDDSRLSHLMIHAELDAIICSGPLKGRKQTYALLEERVSRHKDLNHEESLAELALRYFTSHGPATVIDFYWWSGLSLTKARQALEMVKQMLLHENSGSETYWFKDSLINDVLIENSVHLLPAFDEYLISYRNRSVSIDSDNTRKAISSNGIFRPLIVINGRVEGIWKRTIQKDIVFIEMTLFRSPEKTALKAIESAVLKYGDFLELRTRLSLISKTSAG